MVRFKDRSLGIIIIPGKPIPIGFKYFALADEGYIFNYECTAPGTIEGENNEILRNREISLPSKGIFTKLLNT
jgi:hypothetical protein